ncbi:MAG TPA: TIGR03663 family protein [Candidatus Hydrogenedentes bacterium]|nr:TIGR03663 family protein [Candidatus Hydrogenedentota bacterium]
MGSSRIIYVLLFLCVTVIAAAYRLPHLSDRPMHGDEANQAVKAGMLFDKGIYHYDPYEHHGPTLYYFTLPSLWLSGAKQFKDTNEWSYRIVPVVFALGLLLLFWPLRSALGNGSVLWAALLYAVSNAMVFYSRYYIQETLLVFFTAVVLLSGWRYAATRKAGWAIVIGIGLGMMHATKETSIILIACMGMACILAWFMAHLWDKKPLFPEEIPAWHLLCTVFAAILVSVVLFSSFFTHARGPFDSVLAYANYFYRAEGAGSTATHEKPWYYYLLLLMYTYRTAGPRWSEAIIPGLALVGAIPILFHKKVSENSDDTPATRMALSFQRFILFYAMLIILAYSLVPYKTPWNVLDLLFPMFLLAGIGAAWLVRVARFWPVRTIVLILLLGGIAQLADQTCLGNFRYPADPRNPYVYAHTSTALMRLVHRVEDIAKVNPDGKSMYISVIRPDADYWPLPWYLRQYDRVGYWPGIPEPSDAPIIIADPHLEDALTKLLKAHYQVEIHGLRPGVFLLAYIRQDLWDAFMAARK